MHETVTRLELAGYTESAFSTAAATPASLLRVATDKGARPEVLWELGRLKLPHYAELRELWDELGDLPIDSEPTSS